jgi:glycosyltransferase involved in cell wall biosynthesis
MNKSEDILFLCQYFYPEYISSATLPLDTALALTKEGFSVGVLCGYPKEYNLTGKVPMEEVYEGIKIKRLKYLQFRRSNFIGRLVNYFSFTFMALLHIFELRKYKCVIVYSNPPVLPLVAAIGKKCFKIKVVFVSYDVYPEIAIKTGVLSKDSFICKMMNVVNKIIFKNIDKVVVLSNEMKNFLLSHRSSISENSIEIIPNWYEDKGDITTEKWQDNSLFSSIKKDGNFVISYFGNMGIAQDLDTIIKAMRELKNDNKVQFMFAGHGVKMDYLKEIVYKEDLKNVTVINFLHGQDFQDALNMSDCFLVSLAEGLTGLAVPSKTYSYMMAGKPIIAIIGEDSDIARDLKDYEAGYVVQCGESDKLVKVINELKENECKRKQMGKNCRNVFLKKYTKERCTKHYINMIKEILEAQ